VYPFEGSYDVRLTVANQYGSDSIYKNGSSSQRGNAAPIPLTTTTISKSITTPLTQVQPDITTVPVLPTATQAPLSPVVTVGASIIGIVAIAIAKWK
jgi:PKD repeat protein